MIQQQEIWKPVPIEPFNRFYEVSNQGKVKSLSRVIEEKGGKVRITKNKLLKYKPISKNNKYFQVGLKHKENYGVYLVHRLVALAFIPNSSNKPQINHINGIKTDNKVGNLEWCTRLENMGHASKTGLLRGVELKGELNNSAKLNKFQVQRIRLLKEVNPKITYKKLGSLFRISISGIADIIHNRTWKHV